jgi:signal transduction histidine kinase
VVADISERYPDQEIETTAPDPITVLTDGAAVEIALREALENAVEHGTGEDTRAAQEDNPGDGPSQVRVTATPAPTGDGVEIGIEDTGSGIPSHELAVVDQGTETSLTHGSGIGLWLSHWAMTAIRGDASFEVTETGTRVTLSVPSLDSMA